MKKLIKPMVMIILFVAYAAWIGNSNYDVGKDIAQHVSAFKVNSLAGEIYATGFHLKYKGKVFIITNEHVCTYGKQLNKDENIIRVDNRLVKIIKIWDKHDLCALESWKDFGLSLASESVDYLDKIILVGHPRGLPTIIREGRMVSTEEACILYPRGLRCRMSNRISALAYGGNSGSPVTNEYGDVVGVLYAGSDHYPHEPLIVPFEYLKSFLDSLIEPIDKLKKIKPLD